MTTKSKPINYNPYPIVQPKQDLFLNDPAKYKLIGGAQGGGKSHACRMEAFRTCDELARVKGLVLRLSRGEAIKNFVEPLLEETLIKHEDGTSQPYLKWVSTRNRITFPNQSHIDIGYCESEADVEKYRGLEYDFVLIEELTQWQYSWWRKIITCMRTKKKIRPFFFGSTNPGGVGHGWVKRLWINKDYIENENPSDYGMTRAGIHDNPILMKLDPEYLPSLMSLPEKERRARLDGDWDVFEGQYFNEWRRDIHVISPFIPIVGVKRRIICLDYGFSPSPSSVHWLALMNSGRVICYRELYETRLRYDQLSVKIAALTTEDEEIDLGVVDPSVISKESEDGNTFEDTFQAAGIVVVAGNNKRIEGWNLVRKYLAPYEDPNTGDMIARLSVTENCVNLIRTIPEMIHDLVKVEDLNSKGEDHACFPRSVRCETPNGMKSVADLRRGDVIRTASGWSSVLAWREMGAKDVMQCKWSNGEIVATPDHPFFVIGRGFVPLQYLNASDKIITCKELSSTASDTSGMENTTERTSAIMGRVELCIGTSGKKRMDQFLSVFTFIIKTATRRIMKWKISKPFLRQIMRSCTTTSLRLSLMHLHGIEAKKGENGTVNTVRKFGRIKNRRSIFARCVDACLSQSVTILQNFVILIAKCGTTTSLECPAVKSLGTARRESVYNISTEDGTFYANGVLVKNCDDLRYGLMELGDNILIESNFQTINEPMKKKSLGTRKEDNSRFDGKKKEEYYRRQYGDTDSGRNDLLNTRF